MNGMWCGSKVGSSIRNSKVIGSPLALTRLPPLIGKPASLRICEALRSSARSWPEPSETGGTNGSPNTWSGTLPRHGSSSSSSSGLGRPLRHHVGVLKHRLGPLIGPVHEGLVGPFEIEGVIQGEAEPRIGEFGPPQIDEPALRARGRIVRQVVALHPSVADRGEIVARRPGARGELLAEQIALRREAFEADFAVTVIFIAQRIEIVLADADRQRRAPPVGDPLVFDVAAGLEAADLVWTRTPAASPGSSRRNYARCNRRARRSAGRPRTTGRRARAFRQSARRGSDRRRFDARHFAQALLDDRVTLLLEKVERERGILRGEPGAVVKPRLRAQRKAIDEPVGRNAHRAGDEAIHRIGLVGRPTPSAWRRSAPCLARRRL